MMNNATKENKRINKMTIGTTIGKNDNFVYLGRDTEREAEARSAGNRNPMVKALCRRCGSIKTYQLNNLSSGATKTCGCGRKNTILNQLIAEYDRRINDKDEIQAKTPNKNKVIPTEERAGNAQYRDEEENLIELDKLDDSIVDIQDPNMRAKVNAALNDAVTYILFKGEGVERRVLARGRDEAWIKGELAKDPTIAKTLRDTAYVCGGKILGKTLDHIGENQLKSSDLATECEYNGYMAFVHEEYDGVGHNNNPKTRDRDEAVILDCIDCNLGVFKISTQLPAFKGRQSETILAVRQYALNMIRANMAHNANVGFNERPVVINVNRRGAIQEVVNEDGKLAYKTIGRISDIIAACC